jgi:hypothetical protein
MRTPLLFLLPLILLLCGCKEEDELAPEPESACLLHEQKAVITVDYGDNPTFPGIRSQTIPTRFIYNNEKQLTGVSEEEIGGSFRNMSSLKYNKKWQLEEVADKYLKLVNEYNGQGQLAKQTRFSIPLGETSHKELLFYTFAYNPSNDLSEARLYNVGPDKAELMLIFRYTYTNGNATSIEELSPNGTKGVLVERTYDAMQAPSPAYTWMPFDPIQPPSANNILSSRATHYFSIGMDSEISYSYTYTAEGFPATTFMHAGEKHQQATTYTYNCREMK